MHNSKRGRNTDRLDGHVGPQAVGQVAHIGHGVLPPVVDHQVGAEQFRRLETGVGQVDGDDPARGEQLGPEYGRQPDGAGSDHDDRVAWLDVSVEDAHLVGGREDVGQHEDLLVARTLGHCVGGSVGEGDPDELGLGAVDEVAEDPTSASEALPVAALAAEAASSAGTDA